MIKELLIAIFLLQLDASSSHESQPPSNPVSARPQPCDCECANPITGKPNLWDIRVGILRDEIEMMTKTMNLSSDMVKQLKTEEDNIVEIVKKHLRTLPACDSGWSYYEPSASCYVVVRGRFSYKDAEMGCKKRGAHVTSMHSKGESDFIQKLAGRDLYWIGLVQNGQWRWADGSPLTYLRWSKGEPDGCCDGPSNNTAVNYFRDSAPAEWGDGPGTQPWQKTHNYVCKKPRLAMTVLTI